MSHSVFVGNNNAVIKKQSSSRKADVLSPEQPDFVLPSLYESLVTVFVRKGVWLKTVLIAYGRSYLTGGLT